MKLPEFLREAPYGEILLTGSRIGLYHVIAYYNLGESAEQLAERWDTLPLDLIQKVLAFYHENKEEVDAYLAREQAAIDHLRATTPRKIDWDELRRRMEAMGRL
ncbi:MAG TPA: DUF433 domain-containing protein [Gemmataceae bacterium]|nr:DUF433 domain-containing protein [Gemmataceae bacterium]